MVIAVLIGLGLIVLGVYLLMNNINSRELTLRLADGKIADEWRDLSNRLEVIEMWTEKMGKSFNQNTESYNRTKGVMTKEIENFGNWTKDATNIINGNMDSVGDVQTDLISVMVDVTRIKDELTASKAPKPFRGKIQPKRILRRC